MKFATAGAAGAVVALLAVAAPAPASAGDVIAFTSNRDGTSQLYLMDADGTGQTRLTSSLPYDDIQPSWSPDGANVVFSRGVGYQSGNLVQSSIVVRNVATGRETVIADDDGVNFRPAWSPDGTRIAYVHGGATQSPLDLWTVHPDGSAKAPLTASGDATQPAWSPDSTRIVFNKGAGGKEIWVLDVASGVMHQLTNGTADFTPSWAPGNRILFTSTRDGGGKQVYVMDPDGSHQQRLANDSGEDKYPSWSPDGTRIAYGRSTVPCVAAQNECGTTQLAGFEIFVMNADGSSPSRVTMRPVPESQFGESFPVWRPHPVARASSTASGPASAAGARELPATGPNTDLPMLAGALVVVGCALVIASRTDRSRWAVVTAAVMVAGVVSVARYAPAQASTCGPGNDIAFVSDRDGDAEIYVMDSDGNNVRQLTFNDVEDSAPEWSPDGQQIAFERAVSPATATDGAVFHVFTMRADGSEARDVTPGWPGENGVPTWSPDGTRIAFSSNRDGNGEIYVMNADGSTAVDITNTTTDEWKPSWGPVADRIVFETYRDATDPTNSDLWTMRGDGTDQRPLVTTSFPGQEWFPQWSRDGRHVAYMGQGVNTAFDLFVVDAGGGTPTDLTNTPKSEYQPAWSPDSSHIVFASNLADGGIDADVVVAQYYVAANAGTVLAGNPRHLDIYTMTSDGEHFTRLTDTPGINADPSYRPLACT